MNELNTFSQNRVYQIVLRGGFGDGEGNFAGSYFFARWWESKEE